MVNIKEFLHIYAIGSVGYSFIEVLWRGYTHWSMGIAGGISLLFMYDLDRKNEKMNILFKVFISALFITFIEFSFGILFNKVLKFNVWDYSGIKFNVMGQICLIYSFLWFVLCIPVLKLCRLLRHRVFDVISGKFLER